MILKNCFNFRPVLSKLSDSLLSIFPDDVRIAGPPLPSLLYITIDFFLKKNMISQLR